MKAAGVPAAGAFRAVDGDVGQFRVFAAAVIQHFAQFDAQVGYGAGHVGGADNAAGEDGEDGVVHAHDEAEQKEGGGDEDLP